MIIMKNFLISNAKKHIWIGIDRYSKISLYCLLTEHTSIISWIAISLYYSPTVFGTYSLCHMRYTCTVMLTYIIWDIHVLWCIAYVIWVVYVVCTIFKILHAYFLQTSFIKIQIILIISPCWKIFNIIWY